MAKRIMTPAEGDRIDLGGKLPQFQAFAHFVYHHLLLGDFSWLRIADVNADKLDDIQFATETEIHAYQMKWSNQQNPPAFTYLNFKEVLPDMISGWKTLKVFHANENKELHVHMITNRKASVNDDILDRTGQQVGNFSDFLENVYKPLKNAERVKGKWIEVLAKLKIASGLSKKVFFDFFKDFTANIGFEMPQHSGNKPEDLKRQQDFMQLKELIINEVANKQMKIHYTKEDLIATLHWEHRFKTTFQHEFFVDKQRYQPINSTIAELNEMMGKTTSGYIFLSGTPGSGKSTLLTQWSRNAPFNVVRYYAFSNVSISQNYSERGEAGKLFFDLVIQLNELPQVPRQTVLPHHDEVYLRGVFNAQLQTLSENYKKTGGKTIIIIDGLDHIPREYQTANSLLASLPAPAAIPEGIIILLGSQTFEIDSLQQDVKNQYRAEQRNISMAFLERRAVVEYIDKYQPKVHLNIAQKEQVFHLSKGHPLQLTYLLEELATYPVDIGTILARDSSYSNIEDYYQKIWDSINDDADLKEMLGLMARIKGEINPVFVNEWGFAEKVKVDLRKKAFHLFSKSSNSWVFFHNSFRQFIIRKTAVDALTGAYDAQKDQGFHRKLADYYGSGIVEPKWNRLFHLYQSKQHQEFVAEATGEAFLKQILAYRPIEKVRQDMRLGIHIAEELQDQVLLVRYLFQLSELYNRVQNFDPINFVEEHLQLGNLEIAIKYMRDDHILNSSKRFALSLSQDLYFSGEREEALKLYNLGEPDEVFNDSIIAEASHGYDKTNDHLEEWASAAVLFENPEKIISIIKNTTLVGDLGRIPGKDNSDHLKGRLFYYAGLSLLKLKKWDMVEHIIKELDTADVYDRHLVLMLLLSGMNAAKGAGQRDTVEKFYQQMLRLFTPENSSDEHRVEIAMKVYRLSGDLREVEKWINGIDQPKAMVMELGERTDLQSYRQRIDLNTLQHIIGKGVDPISAVPSTGSHHDNTMVEFERMLCLIAIIRADALSGKPATQILQRIKPLLEFYYQKRALRDTNKYTIKRLRKAYFELMIEVLTLFGPVVLLEVKEFLLNEFDEHPEKWSPERRCEVLFDLIESGVDKSTLIIQITNAESELLDGTDMAGRVERSQAQASRWFETGEPEKAEKWMQRAIEESLSIGYRKDYQLNTWMEWLAKVNKVQPELGGDRLMVYLARLGYVKDVTETRPFFLASKKLLNITYQWNYGAGVNAHQYMLKKGLVHYEDALEAFVRACLNHEPKENLPAVTDMFLNILLDLAEEEHTTLFRELLQMLWENRNSLDLKQELNKIANKIQINSLNVHRSAYFSEIIRFGEKTGYDITGLPIPQGVKAAKENFEYDNHLMLKDHSTLTEEEVMSRITNFESLKDLFVDEDRGNSHFRWKRAFEKIDQELTPENIRDLAGNMGGRYKISAIYFELSNAAVRRGDSQLAWEMANLAIERSSSSGWEEFYDGGSRINGFRALQAVENGTAIKKAFSAFTTDLLATEYPTTYTESIDEILPVIAPEVKLADVYVEVHRHVQNLLSNATPDPDAIGILNRLEVNYPSQKFDLLHYLCHTPAVVIRDLARQYTAAHLNDFLPEDIVSLSNSTAEDQELFIELLTANRGNISLLKVFEPEILKLCCSNSFTIQHGAAILAYAIDPCSLELDETFIVKPLSPTYTLEFNDLPDFRPKDTVDEEGNIMDTEDVSTLTKIVRVQAKAIAHLFGFKEINIHHRLYAIMKELGEPYIWSSANERKIRENLADTGNKMSFTRPRVEIVIRAMSRMVVELAEAGYEIPEEHLIHFIHKDVAVWSFREKLKPPYISQLKEKYSISQEWVDAVKSHPRLKQSAQKIDSVWTVIGEYHNQRALDWGVPEENYQSQLRLKKATDGFHRDFIFGSAMDRLVDDYLYVDGYLDSGYLVVTNENHFLSRTMRSNWIAFNPKIAAKLGWELAEEGNFAWNDANGDLVSHSVYWKNGNGYLGERVSDAETGEGWYVAVSEKGMNDIINHSKDLVFEKRIDRNFNNDGYNYSETTAIVQKFKND